LSLPCGTHPSDTVTSLCVFVCGTHPSSPLHRPLLDDEPHCLVAGSDLHHCSTRDAAALLFSSSLSPSARWRKRPRPRCRRRKHRLRPGCSIGDALLELKTGESQVTALRSSPTSRRASSGRFRDDLLLGDGCHGSFGQVTNFGGKFYENVWDSGGDWGGERRPLLLQVGCAVRLGTSRAHPFSSTQARSCSSSPPTPCNASPSTIASRFALSRSASPMLRTPSARAFAMPWVQRSGPFLLRDRCHNTAGDGGGTNSSSTQEHEKQSSSTWSTKQL
jgi:hypothetical protein